MEAKGLMVGDLIKTKNNFSVDNELNNKYCKVQFLGDKYIAAVLIDEPEKRPYGDEESFEEIPLTPEILEKNGFKVYEQDFTSNTVYEFGSLDYMEFEGFHKYFDIGSKITYRHFGREITYIHSLMRIYFVHELQHALRLCGINKEIII